MKMVGKIKTYNGKYGVIISQDGQEIDFEVNDVSLEQSINVGSIVEFRVEIRFPNIRIARNINVLPNTISVHK